MLYVLEAAAINFTIIKLSNPYVSLNSAKEKQPDYDLLRPSRRRARRS